LIIIFAGFYRSYYVAPFKVPALPKAAPALTTAEVEDILSADFSVIRRVQQIPAPVKADYTALANEPFEMVNPGQKRSTDGIIPGFPNKELVFVGLAGTSSVVLVFKRGGLNDTTNVAVFSHRGGGGIWGARINDSSGHDIAGLRNAVHNGQFKAWDRAFLFANPLK